MKNKYADKELNVWSKEEDNIAIEEWHKFKFTHSSHQPSKFLIIAKKLKEAGFKRTVKAVSRRCFRLGLKSYIPNDKTIPAKCMDCKREIEVKARYFTRNKEHRCPDCQIIRNRKWDRDNHDKKILYCREWRKNDKKGSN